MRILVLVVLDVLLVKIMMNMYYSKENDYSLFVFVNELNDL